MSFRSIVLCGIALLLTVSQGIASEDPQANAEKLLEHARQISDIRKAGAPSFRLKATFSVITPDLETLEGNYSEVWMSDSQWRREIVAGDRRRVEVGSPNRIWLQNSSANLPEHATRLPNVLAIFPSTSAKVEFESVGNLRPDQPSSICAVTKPAGPRKAKHAFCFDEKTGLLIENIAPEFLRDNHLADYSCAYADFREFGEQLFPYEINCVVSGHRQLDVHVIELTTQPSSDPALFSEPVGAIEIGRCPSGSVQPKPVSTPDPMFPAGERGRISMVTVRMVVDVKGKPQNVEISQSGGKSFDEMAAGTVRNWRFKPATCNGEPMPLQITVEIMFKSFR